MAAARSLKAQVQIGLDDWVATVSRLRIPTETERYLHRSILFVDPACLAPGSQLASQSAIQE